MTNFVKDYTCCGQCSKGIADIMPNLGYCDLATPNIVSILNMTPHKVDVIDENNLIIFSFPSSGTIRLEAKTVCVDGIGRIPLSKTIFGEPVGLPKYQEGTYYIVSQLVKSALPQRTDLLVPAEVIRDKEGNIIGCRSLGL